MLCYVDKKEDPNADTIEVKQTKDELYFTKLVLQK